MANGNQDDLWKKVNRIAEEGCGIRYIHDGQISKLFEKTDVLDQKLEDHEKDDREERIGMYKKIVIGVLCIVVAGMVINMAGTWLIMSQVLAAVGK